MTPVPYPIPYTPERRSWPEPAPTCRICFEEVPTEDFGSYDECGALCNDCSAELDAEISDMGPRRG